MDNEKQYNSTEVEKTSVHYHKHWYYNYKILLFGFKTHTEKWISRNTHIQCFLNCMFVIHFNFLVSLLSVFLPKYCLVVLLLSFEAPFAFLYERIISTAGTCTNIKALFIILSHNRCSKVQPIMAALHCFEVSPVLNILTCYK